jgi:hypothetical protein
MPADSTRPADQADKRHRFPLLHLVARAGIATVTVMILLAALWLAINAAQLLRDRDLVVPGPEWILAPLLIFFIWIVVGVLVSPALLQDPSTRANLAEPADRLKADHDTRTLVVQAVGGLLLLGTWYFTWREVQASQEQLRIARQGQLTERLTQAVGQLGTDSCEVRTGGAYALGLIAKISPEDRGSIMEVLTAYVRHNASWPPQSRKTCTASPTATTRALIARQQAWRNLPELQVRAPDVQAALTVITRQPRPPNAARHELPRVDLRRALLRGGHLENAILTEVHLEGASLANADLSYASLEGAQLCGANLAGVKNLSTAALKDSVYDSDTIWPRDFRPESEGARQGRCA